MLPVAGPGGDGEAAGGCGPGIAGGGDCGGGGIEGENAPSSGGFVRQTISPKLERTTTHVAWLPSDTCALRALVGNPSPTSVSSVPPPKEPSRGLNDCRWSVCAKRAAPG